MDLDILGSDMEFTLIQVNFDFSNIRFILDSIKEDFKKTGKTTNIQVDVLVILFRITENQRIFNLLYLLHQRLLYSIIIGRFNYYKSYLYEEDSYDMQGMLNEEFVRRVRFYKIPSETPFSGYCKNYLKKWLNRYTQLIIDKNIKCILTADMDGNDE